MRNAKFEEGELERSLADLVTYLSKHYNQKVIILIDDYDMPLRSIYRYTIEGRGQDYSDFKLLADFFGEIIDHPQVEKNFITGVFPSSFMGLSSSFASARNYPVISSEFAGLFGFTSVEVESFINRVEGLEDNEIIQLKEELQRWYHGYYFIGNTEPMYNSWSVAQFFNDLPSISGCNTRSHWSLVNNSDRLGKHLYPRYRDIQVELVDLMLMRTIRVEVDIQKTILDLDDMHDDSAFWRLLLHKGYLSARQVQQHGDIFTYDVSIPNHEVSGYYARLIRVATEHICRGDLHIFTGSSKQQGLADKRIGLGDNLEHDNKRSRHNSEENEWRVTVTSLPSFSSSSSSQSNIFAPTKASNATDEDSVRPEAPKSGLLTK